MWERTKPNKRIILLLSDRSEINKQNLFWKGRAYFVKGNQGDLDAAQVQTSLVMSWHGFTEKERACPRTLQYNSCVLSDLNKKTPQFTQDFSAMMTPRWKPWENNQCYETEGRKATNCGNLLHLSMSAVGDRTEERYLFPFSEICHCLEKRIKTGSTYWQKLVYPQVCPVVSPSQFASQREPELSLAM